jgi:hypothetical protein
MRKKQEIPTRDFRKIADGRPKFSKNHREFEDFPGRYTKFSDGRVSAGTIYPADPANEAAWNWPAIRRELPPVSR